MDRNVGGLDRIARVAVALVLIGYGYRNREQVAGTLSLVFAGDLLATAIVQRCPGNALLGIDTCPGE